jgi:hemerythrin superfamily protein
MDSTGALMTDSSQDVIAILMQDHREVEQMFAELEGLRGATDEQSRSRRKDLVDQAIIELVRHSVAEEAEVYPKIKERVSEAEAERAKHEHAEAEETMNRLDGLQPDDPTFDDQLALLMREIREHVAEEEGEMFPQMRSIFSAEELVDMGSRVERVKKMAPTRPHPSAPDEPPGDKVLGPVAGLFDRMRDAVSGRGTDD